MTERKDLKNTECFDCGGPFTAAGVGTGYGTMRTGERVCYHCCGERDKLEMQQTGRLTAYLTKDSTTGKWCISNWPGSLKFPLLTGSSPKISKRGGGFGSQRQDAWFVGPDSHIWHAINRGDNEIARCRRTKSRWVQSDAGGYHEVRS